MKINKGTTLLIIRVLLFCILCAVILAATSGISKSLPLPYSNMLSVGLASVGSLLLTVVFARWERLKLKEVGLIPANQSARRLLTGLGIGCLLATLQVLVVLAFGHISIARSPAIGFPAISSNLVLYLLVACREEISFRGYPINVLNISIGATTAQIIIAMIFIIEHKVGGMDWLHAVIGPGMGAILFGVAALKTKGLALPIGLHTSWNFTQWFMGFKPEYGAYHPIIERGYEARTDWLGLASYVFVMCAGICLIQIGWKKVLI